MASTSYRCQEGPHLTESPEPEPNLGTEKGGEGGPDFPKSRRREMFGGRKKTTQSGHLELKYLGLLSARSRNLTPPAGFVM